MTEFRYGHRTGKEMLSGRNKVSKVGRKRLGITWIWRRKWQPTPVFLPGKSQGQKSLVGCRPWGHTELDTTKVT